MTAAVVLYWRRPNHLVWMAINADGQITDTQTEHDLTSIPTFSHQSPLILLLPGERIVIRTVKLPKLSSSERRRAVPNTLEDEFAAEIEALDYFIGEQTPDGEWTVAVVQKLWLQEILSQLQVKDLKPQSVIPDYLALAPSDKQWVIVVSDGRALVRIHRFQGFAIELENLYAVGSRFMNVALSPSDVLLINLDDATALSMLQQWPVDLQQRTQAQMVDYDSLMNAPVNCLHAPKKSRKKKSARKRVNYWQMAGWSAALLVAVLFGMKLIDWWGWARASDRTKAQVAQVTRAQNPKATLEKQLAQLRAQARSDLFIHLLSQVAKPIAEQRQLRLVSINYQNQTLEVAVITKRQDLLAELTQRLDSLGLSVTQTERATPKGFIVTYRVRASR